MLPVKPDFAVEHGGFKQSGKLVLALALMTCSLFWTGCSGISQGSSASSPTPQHLSGQTALPAATVGSNYNDVLSVSGGRSPYNFVVSEGSLPAGLSLNSRSGSISGIPTRAGSFAFTISVTDASAVASEGAGLGGQTARTYSITVSPVKTPPPFKFRLPIRRLQQVERFNSEQPCPRAATLQCGGRPARELFLRQAYSPLPSAAARS